MDQPGGQVLFFQQIKALLPQHLSVADEVAGVLGISLDSAYRRIRGEKAISLEDIGELSADYGLSVDQVLQPQTNGFTFTGTLGYEYNDFVEKYLGDMLDQFQFIGGFDQRHIYFLLNDIPPFAYLQFPELAAFTFFYYRKSLLHFDEMNEMKFSVADIQDNHIKLGKKVQESFNRIPSTEIWSVDTINSILRHIAFYRDTNVFVSEADILCLYDKLGELVEHIEQQAELGVRFSYGTTPGKNAASFRMFHNDLITGDNCGLAEMDNMKVTFINHNLINFMFTRNQHFNNYTFDTFQNAMRKSTQISQVNQKARAAFFDRLRRKIQAQKEAVNHY